MSITHGVYGNTSGDPVSRAVLFGKFSVVLTNALISTRDVVPVAGPVALPVVAQTFFPALVSPESALTFGLRVATAQSLFIGDL